MSLSALTSDTSPADQAMITPKPKSRSLAWLLPLGLIIGFIVILGLLFGERLIPAVLVKTAPVITIRTGEMSNNHPSETSSEMTPTTNTEEKGTLLFQASGWIEPAPYTTFVPSLINGIVDKVNILEGDTVKKDQLLATLIDEDAKLDLQAAEQNLAAFEKEIIAHCTQFEIIDSEIITAEKNIASMQAQLDRAKDSSDRLLKLRKGSISEQDLNQATLNTATQAAILQEAKTKTLNLEAKKNQLTSQRDTMEAKLIGLSIARDRAQLAFDRTQIKAPMDGIILKLHAAPGMKRMLDMDSPTSSVIVEMYDPNNLQARIDVPLNEAAALNVNQHVELVSDILPDQIFTGTVTSISGQADLQRNTLQAKVSIHTPDTRLRPDMLMRAKFYSSNSTSNNSDQTNNNAPRTNRNLNPTSTRLSIYVPESALTDSSSDASVWVVSTDQTAEKRHITLASPRQEREGHLRVTQGLNSGEQVILPPHDELKNGTRIIINH